MAHKKGTTPIAAHLPPPVRPRAAPSGDTRSEAAAIRRANTQAPATRDHGNGARRPAPEIAKNRLAPIAEFLYPRVARPESSPRDRFPARPAQAAKPRGG